MCLDTLSRFSEAIGLYRSLGFRECAPYQSYPSRLMPHLVFMQRPLAAHEGGPTMPPRSSSSGCIHCVFPPV